MAHRMVKFAEGTMPRELPRNMPYGVPQKAFPRDVLCFRSLLERLSRIRELPVGRCCVPLTLSTTAAVSSQEPEDSCSLEPGRETFSSSGSPTDKLNLVLAGKGQNLFQGPMALSQIWK